MDLIDNDRIRAHTASYVNDRIDEVTRAKIERITKSGRDAIIARIGELEHEWDIDRAVCAFFPVVGTLALQLSRRRAIFRNVVQAQMAFLLMHAVVGWCPPVVLLRRLG